MRTRRPLSRAWPILPGGRGAATTTAEQTAMQDDAPIHAAVGKAHLDVLKAAFICDLIRVGTFQWAPGTNHVGFALLPRHDPAVTSTTRTSHRIGTADTIASATPDRAERHRAVPVQRAQLWYFTRHAENFAAWKTARGRLREQPARLHLRSVPDRGAGDADTSAATCRR